MPKMSRPLVWMFAQVVERERGAARAVRDLDGRHFRGDRDGLGDAADLQRELAEVAHFRRLAAVMSATVSVLKLASSTASEYRPGIQCGEAKQACLVRDDACERSRC